jgi:integrase
VSIRWRNGRPIVEVYDPVSKRKRHVKAADFEIEPPPEDASERTLERWARKLEARAIAARDEARPASRDETCGSFAERWTEDFDGHTERGRGESTRKLNAERVSRFAREYAHRTLRSIERPEARAFAKANPSHVAALRAMFNDAVEDGLADANPFARLGIAQSRGRADLIVLTRDEVDLLSATAQRVHGHAFGEEVAAMIQWGAYTCCRPGETFAARYSRLDGDMYDVREQFNTRLRKEAEPKHGSVGLIYVPDPARAAVLDRPRRLADDLMFRTTRGRQFSSPSWNYTWEPVRTAFVEQLPVSHQLRQRLAEDPKDKLDFYELRHFGASYMLNVLELEPWIIAQQLRHTDGGALVTKLYGHPERRVAIERMRRAFTGARVASLRDASGDSRGTASEEGR